MVDVPESFEQDEKELTDMQKLNSIAFSKTRHHAPSRTQRVRRLRLKRQDIMSEGQGVSQVLSQDDSETSSQDNKTLTKGTKPLQINMISAAAFAIYSRKKNHELLAISLRDIEKALSDKPRSDPATLLSECYYDYLDVFSRADSDKLAPHRPYDYDIPLMPGIEPPALPLRNYSQDELRIIRKYLEEHMLKG